MQCKLSTILGEKRLKIADVCSDTGINRGTITRLYHDTATRVELDVIEQLCLYLNIGIEDLFVLERKG
jgi:putative transcriptional regulator